MHHRIVACDRVLGHPSTEEEAGSTLTMKALKVLGIIVVLIVVAGIVFWVGWLKPPAAEDVCGNIAKVMEKEGAKLGDADMKECVERYSRKPEFGLMPWTKKLKCLRDAGSAAELDKCGK